MLSLFIYVIVSCPCKWKRIWADCLIVWIVAGDPIIRGRVLFISHLHGDRIIRGRVLFISYLHGDPIIREMVLFISHLYGDPIIRGRVLYISHLYADPIISGRVLFISHLNGDPIISGRVPVYIPFTCLTLPQSMHVPRFRISLSFSMFKCLWLIVLFILEESLTV